MKGGEIKAKYKKGEGEEKGGDEKVWEDMRGKGEREVGNGKHGVEKRGEWKSEEINEKQGCQCQEEWEKKGDKRSNISGGGEEKK